MGKLGGGKLEVVSWGCKNNETRRRWIRTTGTLIPLGFEIQALNPQSSSAQNLPGARIELAAFGL